MARVNPINFVPAEMAETSSFIPIKKIKMAENKKYCMLGNSAKLLKRINDKMKPIKIPRPPKFGTIPLCELRSLGLATSPLAKANCTMIGITNEVMIKAVLNAENNKTIAFMIQQKY